MKKHFDYLTEKQKEFLAKKIFKKISGGSSLIYTDSEQCFERIKSALEIKK